MRLAHVVSLTALVLALALPLAASAEDVPWKVGDDVMVLDTDGSWYYASIAELKGKLFKVHLPGVGDRTVDASRIRPQTAEEIRKVTEAAATPKGDPEVRRLLEQAGRDYKVDDDGDYRIIYPTKNGRTQLVLVMSSTQDYGTLKIREILSAAYKSKGALPLELARKVLRDDNAVKLGAWRLVGEGDAEVLMFGVHLIGDTTSAELSDMIELVARKADELEIEQAGTDDL
jgi:hypothetical protein